MSYQQERLNRINAGRPVAEKKRYSIPKKSAKKIASEKAEKENRSDGGESKKEAWFQARRKEMTNVCQCGCGGKSSKHQDEHFRSSIAHILPQRIFKSVQFHELNWVERRFWGGCHTRMDEKGMDLWINMADWEDIKAKFRILAPLLSDKERSTKFYGKLAALVHLN